MIRLRNFGRLVIGTGVATILTSIPTTGLAQARNLRTQNFVGPQYPGEVIISERVITPRTEPTGSQLLPTPALKSNQAASAEDSGAGILDDDDPSLVEPDSLSDTARRRIEETRDSIPLFALGHEAWEKMLSLERENAKLQATLEYERRLATFREHASKQEKIRDIEISELRAELKSVSEEAKRQISAGRTDLADALLLIQTRTEQIALLEEKLRNALADTEAVAPARIMPPLNTEKKTESNKKDAADKNVSETKKEESAKKDPSDRKEAPTKQVAPGKDGPKGKESTFGETKDSKKIESPTKSESKHDESKHDKESEKNRKHKSKHSSDASGESPSITVEVLPVGFQLDSSVAELPAPVAEKPAVKKPAVAPAQASESSVDTTPDSPPEGLHGGVLGPLGKNE